MAGSVVGVDNDGEGRPQYLRVAPSNGGEHLLVPLTLIQGIRDDGTVALSCSCSDLDRWSGGPATDPSGGALAVEQVGTIHLHEERLVPHKDLRTVGEVEVRTTIEEFPGRLTVDALREEVEIEHVPVGEAVKERVAPWDEDGVLVVPVYEEQLIVVKRLVMREQLRIRRVETSETRLFEDTLRRERVVVDDPQQTGLIHEFYAGAAADGRPDGEEVASTEEDGNAEGGFLGHLVRRAFG
ncbi:MAG TPA: YsnF/AvaK domain-containing protein [Chloroflexota bacterium]|nr:YsnF/AvaK domain-containing protein [Chloroflexota bacterium]